MATREKLRPFSIEEQKNILTVGACLTCHKSDSEIMINSLNNYKTHQKNLSSECILPTWN